MEATDDANVEQRLSMKSHDVGGREDFGPVDPTDGPPFHHEWEARIFAINRTLLKRGLYTLDQFRDAVERTCSHNYETTPYYERWVRAVEALISEKGLS